MSTTKTPPSRTEQAISELHEPPSILLVEDNSINQQVAIKYLKNLGHTVDLAEDGLAALNACRYDIVFMDCQMPIMSVFVDGVSVLRCALSHSGVCDRERERERVCECV